MWFKRLLFIFFVFYAAMNELFEIIQGIIADTWLLKFQLRWARVDLHVYDKEAPVVLTHDLKTVQENLSIIFCTY